MLKYEPFSRRLTTLSAIYSHMPIPERVRKPDSVIEQEAEKYKHDPSQFRLRWLDRGQTLLGYIVAALTVTDCWRCTLARYITLLFALYGIYSLIS